MALIYVMPAPSRGPQLILWQQLRRWHSSDSAEAATRGRMSSTLPAPSLLRAKSLDGSSLIPAVCTCILVPAQNESILPHIHCITQKGNTGIRKFSLYSKNQKRKIFFKKKPTTIDKEREKQEPKSNSLESKASPITCVLTCSLEDAKL